MRRRQLVATRLHWQPEDTGPGPGRRGEAPTGSDRLAGSRGLAQGGGRALAAGDDCRKLQSSKSAAGVPAQVATPKKTKAASNPPFSSL
jgi:hypothetical protein